MKFKLKHLLPLLIWIISIIPLTIRAETKDTLNKTEVYNDVKSAINTTSPKIAEAIKTISKQLKVTSDKVWDILVKQQRVWSIGFLIGEILTIWCWCHFWYRVKDGQKENWGLENSRKNQDSSYAVSAWITFVLAAFFSVISLLNFNTMLTGFINPEYGAMKTIAEVAQSLK